MKNKFNVADRFMNEIINSGGFPMTRGEVARFVEREFEGSTPKEIQQAINWAAYAPEPNKVLGNTLDGDYSMTADEVARLTNTSGVEPSTLKACFGLPPVGRSGQLILKETP